MLGELRFVKNLKDKMKIILLFIILINLNILANDNLYNSIKPFLGLTIIAYTTYLFKENLNTVDGYIKHTKNEVTRKDLIDKFSVLLKNLKDEKEYEKNFAEICEKYDTAHRHKRDTQLIFLGSILTSCAWFSLLILPDLWFTF